jgi:hypothetical protein
MPGFVLSPSVAPQARDTPMGCWIAGLAMIYNYKYPVPAKSQWQLAQEGGLEFEDYYQSGLPSDKDGLLLTTYNLASLPPQTYTLEGWLDLLQRFGPLAMTVDATKPDDRLTHVAVLQGVEWQSNFSDARFHLIDTANAKVGTLDAIQFAKILETPDVVERSTLKGFAMP